MPSFCASTGCLFHCSQQTQVKIFLFIAHVRLGLGEFIFIFLSAHVCRFMETPNLVSHVGRSADIFIAQDYASNQQAVFGSRSVPSSARSAQNSNDSWLEHSANKLPNWQVHHSQLPTQLAMLKKKRIADCPWKAFGDISMTKGSNYNWRQWDSRRCGSL